MHFKYKIGVTEWLRYVGHCAARALAGRHTVPHTLPCSWLLAALQSCAAPAAHATTLTHSSPSPLLDAPRETLSASTSASPRLAPRV